MRVFTQKKERNFARNTEMAYKKKHKESVTIRYRELADGRKSIYLDIRVDGNRQYRTLNLYLLPETDFLSKQKNKETLALASWK